MRQTLDNEPLTALDPTVELTVKTRVPAKYLLVDAETGQVYKGQAEGQYHWRLQTTDPTLVTNLLANIKDAQQ
jgi:hypothetical protein